MSPTVRALLPPAALLLLFLYQVSLAGAEPFEDAFITFRYAENLAAGGGFAFNAGEKPCQGFTGFTWLALLALARMLGAYTPLAGQLLGLGLSAATVLLLHRTARRLRLTPAWLPPLLLGLNAHFVHHSTSGLETTLFTFLTLAALHVMLLPRSGWRGVAVRALLLTLLAMTRPEGIALAVALVAVAWLAAGSARGSERRGLLWVAAALLLAFALFTFWRQHTFGTLLSAPAQVKLFHWHRTTGSRLGAGLRYTGIFLLTNPAFPLALLGLLPLLRRPPLRRAAYLLAALVVTGCAIIAAEGGDAAHFLHFRFFMPLLPPVCLACGLIFHRLRPRLGRSARVWAAPGVLLLMAFHLPVTFTGHMNRNFRFTSPVGVAFGVLDDPLHPHQLWPAEGFREQLTRRLRTPRSVELYLARWLKENAPGASLATGQMGMIPYHSGLRAYDLVGLTCCEIAFSGGGPFRLPYLRKVNPDLFLLTSVDYHWLKKDLRAGPYRLSRVFSLRENLDLPGLGATDYYLFARPGRYMCSAPGPSVKIHLGHSDHVRPLPEGCVVKFD